MIHLRPCGIGCRWSELQIPPRHAGTGRLRSPGFPVEFRGVGEPHAPFLKRKAHTRLVQCCAAGNPGRDDKGEGGGFHWGSVHGTPGQVARIPGLKSETPRHAGAGRGTLRFLPGGRSWSFLTKLASARHQRMFYKGEVKWGNLKL
jgi:hypothetical protein